MRVAVSSVYSEIGLHWVYCLSLYLMVSILLCDYVIMKVFK